MGKVINLDQADGPIARAVTAFWRERNGADAEIPVPAVAALPVEPSPPIATDFMFDAAADVAAQRAFDEGLVRLGARIGRSRKDLIPAPNFVPSVEGDALRAWYGFTVSPSRDGLVSRRNFGKTSPKP